MCGLVGIIIANRGEMVCPKHEEKLILPLFTSLLEKAQVQGTDATGVIHGKAPLSRNATGTLATINVVKAPVKASEYVKTQQFKKAVIDTYSPQDTMYLLGHTRAATQGNTENNYNNHPFIAGGIVGMHNGMINNYHSLIKEHKLDVKGQCDSEVIFSLIDKWRKQGLEMSAAIQKAEGLMEGWRAHFMVNASEANNVYITRDDTPLSFIVLAGQYITLVATRERWITEALKDTGVDSGSIVKIEGPKTNSIVKINCYEKVFLSANVRDSKPRIPTTQTGNEVQNKTGPLGHIGAHQKVSTIKV